MSFYDIMSLLYFLMISSVICSVLYFLNKTINKLTSAQKKEDQKESDTDSGKINHSIELFGILISAIVLIMSIINFAMIGDSREFISNIAADLKTHTEETIEEESNTWSNMFTEKMDEAISVQQGIFTEKIYEDLSGQRREIFEEMENRFRLAEAESTKEQKIREPDASGEDLSDASDEDSLANALLLQKIINILNKIRGFNSQVQQLV